VGNRIGSFIVSKAHITQITRNQVYIGQIRVVLPGKTKVPMRCFLSFFREPFAATKRFILSTFDNIYELKQTD